MDEPELVCGRRTPQDGFKREIRFWLLVEAGVTERNCCHLGANSSVEYAFQAYKMPQSRRDSA